MHPPPPPLRRLPGRPLRTYVVLACPLDDVRGPDPIVVPLGTVVAATLDGARYLARLRWAMVPDATPSEDNGAPGGGAGAGRRAAGAPRPPVVRLLRVRRASACRTGWLLEALARDGTAGSDRTTRRDDR